MITMTKRYAFLVPALLASLSMCGVASDKVDDTLYDEDKIVVTAPRPPDAPLPSLPNYGTPTRAMPSPYRAGGGPSSPNPGEQTDVQDANDKEDCNGADASSTGAPGTGGNPIVLATGNKVEHELDFAAEGEMALHLRRTYNHLWTYRSLFGKHWLSNFDYTLVRQPGSNNTIIWAQRPDGRRIKFIKPPGDSKWLEDKASAIAYIEAAPANTPGFILHTEDRMTERYDSYGYIQTRHNVHGIGWTFHYTGTYVQSVTHTSGRSVQFKWVANQLKEVIDPQGNSYTYTYDANAFGSGQHRLASTTHAGAPGTTIAYHYENASFPGALTGKSYSGVRYSTFAYDGNGRAIRSEHAGGVDRHLYSYDLGASSPPPDDPVPDPPPPGGICDFETGICTDPQGVDDPSDDGVAIAQNEQRAIAADAILSSSYPDLVTTETNALNKDAAYIITDHKMTSISGYPSAYCAARLRDITYDANGYPDTVQDFNGNITDHDHNAKGQVIKTIEGVGTLEARTTTYSWHASLHRLESVTVVGHASAAYTYDADQRVTSVTIKNLSAHGVLNQTHTTTYSYSKHPNGLLATMTVDGPLPGTGDAVVTTFSAQGDRISVRNSLNHTVSYSQHNALGRPGRITGANGEVVEYQYDARGRVTRTRTFRNGGQQDTATVYNAAGLLQSVTTPDGITTTYIHDAARRLKEITRNEPGGTARQVLTHNNASQVTRSQIFRGNTQHASSSTDYDELGRVRARRGNHGQNVRYGYDGNDNLTTLTDSLNKATTFGYDALNRQITQTDPLGGITRTAYDAGDRVRQVTDPRGLVTTYAYDGFGQLRSQTSPDTGTTTHAWDAGGLITSSTRADTVTVSYSHDSLGRRIGQSASGQSHAYTYDTCANGKGRLCVLSGPGYGENLSYAPYGELANRAITHTGYGTAFDHGFQYDNLGRLTKLTYPNGVEASYGYTLDRATSVAVKIGNQIRTVATVTSHEPMGPDRQLAFGNGGGRINHYDTDGRLTDIETDLKVGYHFDFDANNRINGFTNFANGFWSQSFGYDDLHRLKSSASAGLGHHAYTYDANGNRKSNGTTTYAIANNSNRLMSLAGGPNRTFTYTPTGNIKTIAGFGGAGEVIFRNGFQIEQPPITTYTYNPFDRLMGVSGPNVNASYEISPHGTRFKKTVNGNITDFTYGPNGNLLTERQRTPARWTNYIWFDGAPIALVRDSALYWIQTDHLGRPEGLTDQTKQRVWRATLKDFSRNVITDHIGGFHLGFPGQYHDTETGHAYNINRNYLTDLGRYLESDPIGLAGGINTYAYASGNPVSLIDPLGLCGMGAAFGAMNQSGGNITGMTAQARAQQMQNQAERYAKQQAAKAAQEASKCAAKEAARDVAQTLGLKALRRGATDAIGSISPITGVKWDFGVAVMANSPWTRGIMAADSAYAIGACFVNAFGE
jgi:RHS repeat-associated protein